MLSLVSGLFSLRFATDESFLDMKPDNILADWDDPAFLDGKDSPIVSQILLGDLDSVYDMQGG